MTLPGGSPTSGVLDELELLSLERIRQQEQQRVESTREQSQRNRLGQFATPSGLAASIVRLALSHLPKVEGIRFLEPGFGTGAFYSALLRETGANFVRAAAGYEVDPGLCSVARRLWAGMPIEIHQKDFLLSDPPKEADKFDLIICNPPYVRHHHLSPDYKAAVRDKTRSLVGRQASGLSGLYVYFLLASKAWMKPDGIAAWLVPSEFMDVQYGVELREFLTSDVTLLAVHRFASDDRQFADALVSSSVIVFANSVPEAGHIVTFSDGGSLEKPRQCLNVSIEVLRTAPKWKLAALKGGGNMDGRKTVRLGDICVIKRGIATGCNRFFILSEADARTWNIPRRFLTPVLPSPRVLVSDIVECDGAGEPAMPRRYYLITCREPLAVLEKEAIGLAEYIRHGEKMGIHKRYLCRHRSPWYAQEVREPAPILCTYMGRVGKKGRPFRFIRNKSRAVACNVYLMLYIKEEARRVIDPDGLWEKLRAIPLERLLEISREYGGGLYKMEPEELAALEVNVD